MKVVGLNPGAVYWMDITFFTLICCKKLYCLFEKTVKKRKRGRDWPIFFKKTIKTTCWLVFSIDVLLTGLLQGALHKAS